MSTQLGGLLHAAQPRVPTPLHLLGTFPPQSPFLAAKHHMGCFGPTKRGCLRAGKQAVIKIERFLDAVDFELQAMRVAVAAARVCIALRPWIEPSIQYLSDAHDDTPAKFSGNTSYFRKVRLQFQQFPQSLNTPNTRCCLAVRF